MRQVHIYTRSHTAHAWKYERTTDLESAQLSREVNHGFGVETLLVPYMGAKVPRHLDSAQAQSDFPAQA